MLAKARKSSFNANIGEFCSVIFAFYLDMFRIQAYAIIKCKFLVYTAYKKCPFDFRLSFSYFDK